MKSSSFTFLTSGPTYSVSLPEDAGLVFHTTSPILSGAGARTFAFTSGSDGKALAEGMRTQGRLLEALEDSDGRSVEVFERPTIPGAARVWWLLWDLGADGVVTTHLREVDGGVERARFVAQRISIDSSGPTPYVFTEDPLRPFAGPRPGYQEDAITSTPDGTWLVLNRPGFVREGQVFEGDSAGQNQVRVGASDGIELQVTSSSLDMGQVRDLAIVVAASLGG